MEPVPSSNCQVWGLTGEEVEGTTLVMFVGKTLGGRSSWGRLGMAKMLLGSVPEDAWQLIGILGAAVLGRQPCPGCPERCHQGWQPAWHQSQPWFCPCAPGCPQSGHSIPGLAQHTKKCPGWSLAGAGGHRKNLKLWESI